jgi:hypothetical protein
MSIVVVKRSDLLHMTLCGLAALRASLLKQKISARKAAKPQSHEASGVMRRRVIGLQKSAFAGHLTCTPALFDLQTCNF